VGTGVTQSRSYSTVRGWLHPNSDTAFNEIEDVIYVGGAALFMSRKCLEDIKENGKYFDEQFDFYFEDFDLALRAQEKGYKVQYCPLSTFIHCHEGSLRECQPGEMGSRDWRHRKHFENRDKFVKKWPMIRV
jgi:GT2 family glycosyltransferase